MAHFFNRFVSYVDNSGRIAVGWKMNTVTHWKSQETQINRNSIFFRYFSFVGHILMEIGFFTTIRETERMIVFSAPIKKIFKAANWLRVRTLVWKWAKVESKIFYSAYVYGTYNRVINCEIVDLKQNVDIKIHEIRARCWWRTRPEISTNGLQEQHCKFSEKHTKWKLSDISQMSG